MINLGNGQIYLDKGELVPFGCPKCHSPVPYQSKDEDLVQVIVCPTCEFIGGRDKFQLVLWRLKEAN